MISGPEFLFPAHVPVPSSTEYLKMIAEIGKENRISRWFFFGVGVLLLTPVVLFGSMGLWHLVRAGSIEPELFIAGGNLFFATIAFSISRNLSKPLRPYQLPTAEYANYTVVEARVTRLGLVWTQKTTHRRSRKIRWESAAPLARQGWSPSIPVAGGLFNPVQSGYDVRVNDVAYVGLDPAGRLPPLFLGLKRAARAGSGP
jgi:hypothetical protein